MNISKHSRIALFISTGLWAVIMLVISILMYCKIDVSQHFSYYVLLEFSKAIDLWYILCVLSAFAIDVTNKKRR